MKEYFQIMYIDDKYKSGNGIGYAVGLINLDRKGTGKYFNFGITIDGDDYREDCWRADIGIGDSDVEDMISYVDCNGDIHEYERIDSDFKEEIVRILNIKEN